MDMRELMRTVRANIEDTIGVSEKGRGEKVNAFDKIRKPTAPATLPHKDKNRYTRKDKHKDKIKE